MLVAAALLPAMLALPLLADEPVFCIAGSVVNSVTGEPVRRAAVTLPQTAALTEAGGVFRFCGLPAGTYYTHAEKPGFVDAGVKLVVGPSHEDVALRLSPLGVLRGKVVDGDDAPLENVLMQLLSATVQEGRRKVRIAADVATDDRGVFRLPGLTPGRYYLRAAGWQGNPDSNEAFAPIYYGGASEITTAAPLTVEPGRELDADFSLTLAPSYTIRGVIAGFAPRIATKIELLRGGEDPTVAPVLLNSATGAFEVNNVTPGSYVLQATQGEGEQRVRGEQPVQVSAADVNNVALALAPSTVLQGIVRVTAVSGSASAAPSCAVELRPLSAWLSSEEVFETSTAEDGAFAVAGVLPGRYRLRLACANGYISAVRFGDADLLARNEVLIPPGIAPPVIEAVLSTDGGTVDVTTSFEGARANAWVVLLGDGGSDFYTRFAICRDKLSFAGVAPGDYQAYAWTGSPEVFEYANPDMRAAWASRAVSVHLSARDHQSITLKVAPGETP